MEQLSPVETEKRIRTDKGWLPWLLLLLAVAALTVWLYFFQQNKRFAEGTVISGVDCALLTPDQAAASLLGSAGRREIRLCTEDGTLLGSVSLAMLTANVDYAAQTADFLTRQRQERGFFHTRPCTRDFTLDLSVPAEELSDMVEDIVCGRGYVPEPPEDAYLALDEQGVHIQPETTGNLRNLAVCTNAVAGYLSLDGILTAANPTSLYIKDALFGAEVTSNDGTLKFQRLLIARYTNMDLTVEFCGGRSYTFTPADILSLLDLEFTAKDVRITVKDEAVIEFLDELIDTLGADGVDAKYGNVADTREYVYYTVEDRGFILDRETLYSQVLKALKGRDGGSITANYDYDWWLRKTYGYMGELHSIIEISIPNQYLWFYCDGQLLTETPVTTGCIATKSYTNTGAFRVSYLTADTFLNGPTWHYHVDYWIPFDGDIGLHDSSWRENYGGDEYLTDGSHGCVNTPLEHMRIIFENSRWDTAVIVR